jgi:hypothetical protein
MRGQNSLARTGFIFLKYEIVQGVRFVLLKGSATKIPEK